MSHSYLARLVSDEATANRIMTGLAELLDSGTAATALTAEKDGSWAVEAHFLQEPDREWLRDIVAEFGGKEVRRSLTFSILPARDWVKASLAGLQPVCAGRFIVHGRHDRARVPPNRVGIEIEAALAFGTGHHGTTRGCLLALDGLAKRISSGHHRNVAVLDVGTGSGVLAIAAAKALRRPVLAGDIDRAAVAAAKANVALNASAPLVEVVHAGGLSAPRIRARGPYALVFANILLAPLKLLADPIARVLAPGSRVVLSGLLASQASAARTLYGSHGLKLERRIELDGWATLVMVRPGRSTTLVAHSRPDP